MSHDVRGPWLTLCFALREYAHTKVEHFHLLDDLCDEVDVHGKPIFRNEIGSSLPEIKKAIEIVTPILMLDFLMENTELLDKDAFAQWAQRQNDHSIS